MTRHSGSAPKKVMVFLVLLMRVHDTTSLHAHHSQQRRMRRARSRKRSATAAQDRPAHASSLEVPAGIVAARRQE